MTSLREIEFWLRVRGVESKNSGGYGRTWRVRISDSYGFSNACSTLSQTQKPGHPNLNAKTLDDIRNYESRQPMLHRRRYA